MQSEKQIRRIVFLAFVLISLVRCNSEQTVGSRLGKMKIPSDNPMSSEKIKLGKKLFFDKRLSLNNTIACASCHIPEMAFTDGKRFSPGVHGKLSRRNTPTLTNVGYNHKFMFDGEISSLEMQAIVPLIDSLEMANDMGVLIKKLREIEYYRKEAKRLFKREFDAYVLTRSLSAFQRTIVSYQSPFDHYQDGNENAISKSAQRGWRLFSEKLYCTKCHAPPYFTNFKNGNNGLYANYTAIEDKGRFRINGDSSEIGSFKIPTLRNISKTAPYMHDGSMNTLWEVIDHYKKGGNNHINQSAVIQSFTLRNQEKVDLIVFLNSLSDPIK